MIVETEETLNRPESLTVPLRFHPSFRGRWPAYPCSNRTDAANPGNEDVLELVTLRSMRVIVMRSHYGGVTYYRTLCLTNKAFVMQLAAFLRSQIGETIDKIGSALVDF